MFDSQGHLELPALRFRQLLVEKPMQEIANNYLMVGTPRAFATYDQYCGFARDLGYALGVHCRSLIVRGSAHLGYSIKPKADAVWRPFGFSTNGELSDIDIAIVDADYFDQLDAEVRAWESRQHRPEPDSKAFKSFADRGWARRFGCIKDFLLPPLTCIRHRHVCTTFSTERYCDAKRSVSAFIFRSWHALLSRWEIDLGDLKAGLDSSTLPEPDEAFS